MKIKLLLLTLVAIVCSSCNQKPKIEVNDDESIVYFCSEITPENILKLYNNETEILICSIQRKNRLKSTFWRRWKHQHSQSGIAPSVGRKN